MNEDNVQLQHKKSQKTSRYWKWSTLLLILVLPVVLMLAVRMGMSKTPDPLTQRESAVDFSHIIAPVSGVELPFTWGSLGKRMTEAGVIDMEKFTLLYASRGGIDPATSRLLNEENNSRVVINRENAGVLLNLLWAFGLSNKNEILESGPIMSAEYGGDPGQFASTGGWRLAKGDSMDHYSMHTFVVLNEEEQKKVERVSEGVYRPCCGNATHFPDCNHGMAMLGLLELLAHEGVTEDEMYAVALVVNSYWFPETYATLAAYFDQNAVTWKDVDPKVVLGAPYSSGAGYRRILSLMTTAPAVGGGGCSA